MYALALIRYRYPLDTLLPHVEEHRAYLRELKAQGTLIASGPLDPRNGGALLLRVPEDGAQDALDAVRDNDPYTRRKLVQYELLPWMPVVGKEDLDRL